MALSELQVGEFLAALGEKTPAPASGAATALTAALAAALEGGLIADAVMSLDNVVAIAAAAHDSVLLIGLGLLISIPLIVFGSQVMLQVLNRFPILVMLGGGLLGWIAGEMMVSDPAITGWVDANAPWLKTFYVAKIAGALLVVAIGKAMASRKGAVAHGSTPDQPEPLKSTRS